MRTLRTIAGMGLATHRVGHSDESDEKTEHHDCPVARHTVRQAASVRDAERPHWTVRLCALKCEIARAAILQFRLNLTTCESELCGLAVSERKIAPSTTPCISARGHVPSAREHTSIHPHAKSRSNSLRESSHRRRPLPEPRTRVLGHTRYGSRRTARALSAEACGLHAHITHRGSRQHRTRGPLLTSPSHLSLPLIVC